MPSFTWIQVALQPYQTVIAAFTARAGHQLLGDQENVYIFVEKNSKYLLRRNTESETGIHSVVSPITLREIIP